MPDKKQEELDQDLIGYAHPRDERDEEDDARGRVSNDNVSEMDLDEALESLDDEDLEDEDDEDAALEDNAKS